MEVIRGLIPLMIILGIVGVVIFFWTVRSGQYDDLEGDANRILMDDDLTETKSTPPDNGENDAAGEKPDKSD